MIKNEKQYLITKSKLDSFQKAFLKEEHTAEAEPIVKEIKLNGLKSIIEELKEEIAEYEKLKEKSLNFSIGNFEEIPTVLIKARINSGLSHKALAEKLDMKEQQIQRYEATNYASASLSRILEIAGALNLKLENVKPTPTVEKTVSAESIFKQLGHIGLSKKFILKRLILTSDLEAFQKENISKENTFETALLHAASTVSRIYNWSPSALFDDTRLELELARVGAARFKAAVNAEATFLNAYAVYAHYLSLLVLSSLPKIRPQKITLDAQKIRNSIRQVDEDMRFETIFKFVWGLGIPILPLKDEGAFKGASWRINGKNIIALKQGDLYEARWSFLLLHELFHTSQEPEKLDRSVIEEEELTTYRTHSEEEELASEFAVEVLLGKDAEDIVEECVSESKGSVERLKMSIGKIAKKRKVNIGHLADYMAFRLKMQNVDWWGTATNLQEKLYDPWERSRDFLMGQLYLDHLNEIDREILLKALS